MKAAIYARKSTDQGTVADEAKSVARQIDHARAYATRKGWTVEDAHVYVDDGISGAEFAARPGYMRLLNALNRRAPFNVLVVSELSRLGREQLETGFAVKQLSQAGVRIFSYLDDREVLLETSTDKFLMSAVNFGAELEREKARQRAIDTSLQKFRRGYVTGGRTYGYDNQAIVGPDGRRSHVERRINETEAAIVRRIFEMSASGFGLKAIAKSLNAEGALSPRAQRGRSQTWAPSSVREVLHRDLYRGVSVWNRTRKRDQWGQQRQSSRPASDWLTMPAPHLAIVTEEAWLAAHRRLTAVRGTYRRGGRPAPGDPSKYLLTNLALCGCCGGSMRVRSGSHGTGRRFAYGCSAYHERGRTVCANGADVPMLEADAHVIEALLDEVLDMSMVRDAVDVAVGIINAKNPVPSGNRVLVLERELAKVERERDRIVAAIATGGQLGGLLVALQGRESRLSTLQAELAVLRSQPALKRSDAAQVRRELLELAESWRTVLAHDQANARPIVAALLKGRVTITPTVPKKEWEISGEGTLAGFFSRLIFPSGWRPHTELDLAGMQFRRLARAA